MQSENLVNGTMILNKYLTLWQWDNLNLGLSTQKMPNFSRVASTFHSTFVDDDLQSCAIASIRTMTWWITEVSSIACASMCMKYGTWGMLEIVIYFLLWRPMKKVWARADNFLKTCKVYRLSFPGAYIILEPILNFSQTVWKDFISHQSNDQTANWMDWCSCSLEARW